MKLKLFIIFLTVLLCACSPAADSIPPSASEPEAQGSSAVSDPASTPPQSADGAPLSVLFINVGRADATLIQTGGKAFLIDTGEKQSVPALYRALAVSGVTQLDGVFLTHTHADHIGGTEALTQKYPVDMLYSAEISMNDKKGKNKISKLAAELSLPHKKLSAGDTVEIAPGVYFEVLGPLTYNADDDNDNSLVMRLHAGGVTVLLTGDMQFAEENTLLQAGANVSANVLKVGNHGNPDASSDAFISAVGAKTAVISTHSSVDTDTPAPRVLSALGSADVYVTQNFACGALLTAKDGAISVSDPAPPAPSAEVAIQSIDTNAQTITLVNNGPDADLGGCIIHSEKGNEVFVFPEGAALQSGQTLTVACTGGRGDYIWNDKKVWSSKDDEAGVLYDAFGNELSRSGAV